MEKLAEVAPDLHGLLADLRDFAGEVVRDPGNADDINFLVEGRLFYAEGLGARAHAQREVARYLAAPRRLFWPPTTGNESPCINFVRDRVDALVGKQHRKHASQAQHHRASVLILFGIGLGEPVRFLLDALVFRHVIIVEPITEFLWHSLWLQEWASWYDLLAARGGTLHVVTGEDVEYLSTTIHNHLLSTGAAFDGTYCYGHYSSLALNRCADRFAERVNAGNGEGYFEDELVMMINSTRNFSRSSVKLVTNHRPTEKTVPAIICGAGPSLTKAMPHLAALRDGAVLLSAGTTIGALLRHGIVPDFHCELENTEDNYQALLPVAAVHDLSAVTLIASATVDSRMPALFGDSLLFVRDPGMSSSLYGTDETSIIATTPNCVTVATRMVARFGFRTVYLFGTDFGSRRPDQHHAADSIWMTDPAWRERYDRIAETMNLQMAGNFGGKIYSNRLLEQFLHSTQRLIAMAGDITFFNCADGARIEGAIAKLPSQANFPIMPDKRLAAVEEIRNSVATYPAGGVVDQERIREFRRKYRTWTDGLLVKLQELSGPGGDLIDLHDAIHLSLANSETGHLDSGVRMLAWGSMALMFRHAFHYAIRNCMLDDHGYKILVIQGFIAALTHMRQRLDEIMTAEFDFLASEQER